MEGKLTVYFEDPFWVGVFERVEDGKLSVCKVIFGAEPKDYEVWELVLQHYNEFEFSPTVETDIRRTADNPKRRQRNTRKQLEHTGVGTKSQQALQLLLEQNKQERRLKSRDRKLAEAERKFTLKQQKKKKSIKEDKAVIHRKGLPITMTEKKIEIKQADRNNFCETSMGSFDRFQEVQNVWRLDNGRFVLNFQPFTETWLPEQRRKKAEEILSGRYLTFCAFEGDAVVGENMLIPELNENRLIIDSFHVSRAYRRHGIGRRLLEAAADYARARGASALYASCCSAEETIGFYRAMGFRLSEQPIPSRVEEEPFDLQMECRL